MGFAYLHTELGRWAMYRPCINIKQRLNYAYLRVRVSCLNPRTSERPTTFAIGEFGVCGAWEKRAENAICGLF